MSIAENWNIALACHVSTGNYIRERYAGMPLPTVEIDREAITTTLESLDQASNGESGLTSVNLLFRTSTVVQSTHDNYKSFIATDGQAVLAELGHCNRNEFDDVTIDVAIDLDRYNLIPRSDTVQSTAVHELQHAIDTTDPFYRISELQKVGRALLRLNALYYGRRVGAAIGTGIVMNQVTEGLLSWLGAISGAGLAYMLARSDEDKRTDDATDRMDKTKAKLSAIREDRAYATQTYADTFRPIIDIIHEPLKVSHDET